MHAKRQAPFVIVSPETLKAWYKSAMVIRHRHNSVVFISVVFKAKTCPGLWFSDWLSECRIFQTQKKVLPLLDITCLVVLLSVANHSSACAWSPVVMGTIVHPDTRDQDSGLCVTQLDNIIASFAETIFKASEFTFATEGEVRYSIKSKDSTYWLRADLAQRSVFTAAKSCAGYLSFLCQLPGASFYGHGKPLDARISKRVAVSLSILVVKRFKSLLESTMDQIFHLFLSKAKNTQRQDFALLALCIVARLFEHLAALSLEGTIPDIIVRIL